MLELAGYIDHIIFRNRDNGYTVLVFICEEDGEEITAVGNFVSISAGENMVFFGDYTEHAVYGTQFVVKNYEVKVPEDEEAIMRYLGSGAIKGVGIALAGRIVKKFGKETFRIIEKEPERLAEVRGISERMAAEISDQMIEKTELRSVMLFLLKYGITNQLAIKIYQKYGADAYRLIEENPYKLTEDIHGIGFQKADEIARNAGIKADSPFRVRSGILYVLTQEAAAGHTFLEESSLIAKARMLLEVESDNIERAIMDLSIEKKIAVKGERLYLYSFYYMEEQVASMLLNLDSYVTNESNKRHKLVKAKNGDIALNEAQWEAVEGANQRGVTVLTGGPGTGKTTTIQAMIAQFEGDGKVIELAAPTGRAAKRMSEATGFEARTIHRLLEVGGKMPEDANPEEMVGRFGRDDNYPLEADVIIIDEASMVDLSLFFNLLKAIPLGTRLVLVGDIHQLPSIGVGNVLKDIIESECFFVKTLDTIFRQAEKSDIVVNAHKMQNEQAIVLDNKSEDFFFLERDNAEHTIRTLITLVKNKIPKYVHATPYEIQVLTPTRKGLTGVERLNEILQAHLNAPSSQKREHTFGERLLREGDKVMQIKNNYQMHWEICNKKGFCIEEGIGVFNGDIGIVESINEFAQAIRVEFDEGRMVTYSFKQVDELELAYAITVHKSQGSEYPAVLIPLLNGPQMLMNRNLIYTAITRAKSCVVLIGDKEIFYKMVANTQILERNSSLKESIRHYYLESSDTLTRDVFTP